jgi:hypothetical protein
VTPSFTGGASATTSLTVKPADEEGTGTPKVGIPMSRPNNKVVEIPKPPDHSAWIPYYMGVSPWFLEQEIRARRLSALKLCRHYTLLKEDLDAYLDDARRKAA